MSVVHDTDLILSEDDVAEGNTYSPLPLGLRLSVAFRFASLFY